MSTGTALAPTYKPRAKTTAQLEDIEFLIGCGETAENVARRAGFKSVASMGRLLSRHGRGDLLVRMCQENAYRPRSARAHGVRLKVSR